MQDENTNEETEDDEAIDELDTARVLPSGMLEVTAKVTDGPSATVTYDFGENVDAMTEKFGKEVVFTTARQQMKIQLQAAIRRALTSEPRRDAVAMAAMWKPGVIADRVVDPLAVAKQYFASLTDPAEKKAFLENLRDL